MAATRMTGQKLQRVSSIVLHKQKQGIVTRLNTNPRPVAIAISEPWNTGCLDKCMRHGCTSFSPATNF